MVKSGHPREVGIVPKARMNWQHFVDLIHREIASGIVSSSLTRLLLAAILGGAIGLEREYKHRPAGLRTNMFICFGAALFTLLSRGLAAEPSDYTRIAAQIIPGIGFIGAGSILHTRGLTTGLTTAATIFVVASVGMAAGGGLYLTAMFATVGSLFLLGFVEESFNIKLLLKSYEVSGPSIDEITHEVNRILESQHRLMQNVLTGETGQHVRLQFDVEGCAAEQRELFRQLKTSTVFGTAISLGRVERE
jgi:putative Mg2+ transporter-C (MgtC) family protein